MRRALSPKDVAFFRAMNHPLIYGPYVLGLLVLFVVPPTTIDGIVLIGPILRSIANWIPAIPEHVKYSAFPEEARAFLALVFLTAPIQIVVAIYRLERANYVEHQLAYWKSLSRTDLRTIRLGAPVMTIVAALGVFLVGEDPSICRGCTSHSKLGLLFFGGIAPLMIGLLAYFSVLLLRHYRSLVPMEPRESKPKHRVR